MKPTSKPGTWTACALTLGNLLCGFTALTLAARGFAAQPSFFQVIPAEVLQGAWLIFLGMIMDALDGRVARMARGDSAFGAELDSLADVVTFGVAPAALAWVAAVHAEPGAARLLWIAGAAYASCAAIRLARYNVKQQSPRKAKSSDFEGLPSPAAAGLVAGLLLLSGVDVLPEAFRERLLLALPAVAALAGVLMVSRVPYLHVPNRLGQHKAGALLGLILLGVLAVYPAITLAVAFAGYALAGLGKWLLARLSPASRDGEGYSEERIFRR